MIEQHLRNANRKRVHTRLRKTLSGTTERPRLNIYRSLKHIYAQVIDDTKGVTLAAASSLDEDLRKKIKTGADVGAAKEVGRLVAERAVKAGIKDVVFDRGSYIYHGRVKALADAARAGGLNF